MGRHETDFLSLTFALLFFPIGLVFLIGEVDPAQFIRAWALPVVLLTAGLVLGAVGLARHRRFKTGAEGADDSDEGTDPALW